jgi:hypothetical protein
MSSRVSSKCTPNFRSLQDEPILREILSYFSQGFTDSRTCGLTCLLGCHQNASNFACYLYNEPYLEFYLELFYVTRGLSDLQTHMYSMVSSKCIPNFHSLQDEPILRKILKYFSRAHGLSDLRLTYLLWCHQNAPPTFVTSIMNHT